MGPAERRPAPTVPGRLDILLIAYEFPPSPSAQSLRWAYLTRELALRGHRVQVLAPEHPGSGEGLPSLPNGVVVHRTFAGPAMGMLNVLARRGRRNAVSGTEEGIPAVTDAVHPPTSTRAPVPVVELNWKGHVHNAMSRAATTAFHAIQRWTSAWLFPDGRAEWYPWARRRLLRLLGEQDVDIVVSSHEPATTLSLGLEARRMGYPWIADMGDPVLAPYTAPRWRQRAGRVEAAVCASADLVVVTTAAAVATMTRRHGVAARKFAVLTQGFADRMPGSGNDETVAGGPPPVELLYTGSLYGFRRIEPLLYAVLEAPGVRLNIASIAVPEEVREASERSAAIRLLGFLPHAEALAWQRRCDVLVNLANDDPLQVPGKFYEYLGAGRPILHIGDGQDAAARLLLEIARGWVCGAEPAALGQTLRQLERKARDGKLADGLDLSAQAVKNYGWPAIAGRLEELMTKVLAEQKV